MKSLYSWMGDLGAKIGNIDLIRLPIPGTHNSGSFSADMLPPVRTQSMNLSAQLTKGIRFLDLRVTDSGTPPALGFEADTFYLTHNGVSATNLEFEPQMELVNTFAEQQPKKIIILSFHRLLSGITVGLSSMPDMSDSSQNTLAAYLTNLFGDKLIPNTASTVINDIWQSGKNVIVMFGSGPGDCWSTGSLQTAWDEDATSPNITIPPATRTPGLEAYLEGWYLGTEDDARGNTISQSKFNNGAATVWSADIAGYTPTRNTAVLAWHKSWQGNATIKGNINVVTVDFLEDSTFVISFLKLFSD